MATIMFIFVAHGIVTVEVLCIVDAVMASIIVVANVNPV
jgi:hypothetical protein